MLNLNIEIITLVWLQEKKLIYDWQSISFADSYALFEEYWLVKIKNFK